MEANRTSKPITVTGRGQGSRAKVEQEPPGTQAPRALSAPSRLALALGADPSCQLRTVPTESWAREGVPAPEPPGLKQGDMAPLAQAGSSGPQGRPASRSTGGEGTGAGRAVRSHKVLDTERAQPARACGSDLRVWF